MKTIFVGWYLNTDDTSHIFFKPRPLLSTRDAPKSAKALQGCPAVRSVENEIFEIRAPFDLRLRALSDKTSEIGHQIYTVPSETSIETTQLLSIFQIMHPSIWRSSSAPLFQISTPYIFASDNRVDLVQTGPFLSSAHTKLPGTVVSGKFPVNVWPRQLSYAFEWHDVTRDFKLSRGEPWFYVYFDKGQLTKIKVGKIDPGNELKKYQKGTRGVVDYINNTFGLIGALKKSRPRRLMKGSKIDE